MRAANMQALTNDTRARYSGVVIYGVGDDAHKLRVSDHNEDDTVGSKAAQSDADNIPEHRAIDIMLGTAFTKAEADAYVARLLADPEARARLVYIIWNGSIWERSHDWVRRDYDGSDQHTDHVHVSGWAADDENAAGWPAVWAGDDMYCKYGDKGSLNVETLQRKLSRLGYSIKVDRAYGEQTSSALKNLVGSGDGKYYGPMEIEIMDYAYAKKFGAGPGAKGDQGEKGDPGEPGKNGSDATWPVVINITGTANVVPDGDLNVRP